jgi:hypothetical protein
VIDRRKSIWLLAAVLVAATVLWLATRTGQNGPLVLQAGALAGWRVIVSAGTDPWVVGMQPPESAMTSLIEQVSKRARRKLVAPSHPALPLVLRTEFDEGLQGAFGVDWIARLARDSGFEDARVFVPVCLARRTIETQGEQADVYFIPFESPAFNQLRVDLMPEHPEQAGVGMYDPSTLTPILPVAATSDGFERWWPLSFARERDCQEPIVVSD